MKSVVREDHLKYYEFLEALRKSGETNMFGAAPYLESYFGLSSNFASEVLGEWISNYDEINERWNLRERVKALSIQRSFKIKFNSVLF